jgi:large subunit ribosomal protein L17
MRHRKTTAKLSRNKAERERMLRNMVTSLILEERITTSLAKAKAARSLAERVITRGKKDTVHSRRLVARQVYGSEAVKKVFNELGPRYRERPGGYTRILKLGKRLGDAAEECILELVDSPVKVGSEKED